MRRIEVTSSMIRAGGYDPITKTLEIQFNDGRIYRYAGFPAAEHRGLMRAGSLGRYFLDRIRDEYPTQRMRR